MDLLKHFITVMDKTKGLQKFFFRINKRSERLNTIYSECQGVKVESDKSIKSVKSGLTKVQYDDRIKFIKCMHP